MPENIKPDLQHVLVTAEWECEASPQSKDVEQLWLSMNAGAQDIGSDAEIFFLHMY
jgi:hypothetical protein